MMDKIHSLLKPMISTKRYNHSIGVQNTAVKLAVLNNIDINKASMAGLIHDCAKGLPDQELIKAAVEGGIEIDEVSRRYPELLHGPVGAILTKKVFGIYDEEIQHAIRYHTTGCENMSMLDKIIYIADYIEPGRNFPRVEELRNAAYDDINRGVLMAMESTIKYIIERGQLLDTMTVKARNYLLIALNSDIL